MSEEESYDENEFDMHYLNADLDILNNHLLNSTPLFAEVNTYKYIEKIMYVFKINKDKSITGLTFEGVPKFSEIRGANKVDYSPKEWQMQTVVPLSFRVKNYDSPPIDISSMFIKYGWDRSVKYGDGGYCELKYPIYRIQKLPLTDEKHNFLFESLKTLGKKRKDFHKDSPVIDIIDPDLNPNYYYSKSASSNLSERSKYAWFPVDVLVKQDGTVKPLGEIHNLPKEGNEQLYECIFQVFQGMIPGFKHLNIFEENKDQIIQVVVKAQAYMIKPMIAYSGKWHVEGKTENIVAAGVYYCKIDPGLEEDYLSFHPREVPSDGFREYIGVIPQMDAPVNERTAIVFSNTIPHKFCKLTNNTDKNILRLFLNFFVVDPKKRLETNQLRIDSFEALRKASKLPVVLIDEILSFVFSKFNLSDAVEKREAAREDMKNEKKGWGYVDYGNSGDVVFIDDQNRNNGWFEDISEMNDSPNWLKYRS